MTDKERYLFDLNGYITVPNALSAEQIAALNRILDGQMAENVQPDARNWRCEGMLGWGKPYRELIDNPRITPYLEEIVTPQFRLDHDYTDVIRPSGASPTTWLHGGGTPFDSCMFYNNHNGKIYSGLMVVAYNLGDVNPGDGGFGCVPGSHKANYPIPEEWKDLSKNPEGVKAVTGPAGTAILFTEALTHGTLPWRGRHERRTLFFKYSPPSISWYAKYYDHKQYDDLTERQRAILEEPNARYSFRPK
jgi:hypothetical protein